MQRVFGVFLGATLLAGCAEIDPTERVFDPSVDSGTADFSVFVAVGNSLTAGIQDAGLIELRQAEGIPAQIARSLGKSVMSRDALEAASGEFVLPGYGAPGSAGTLRLTSLSPPSVEPVNPPGRPVNVDYPSAYNNLAVPGATAGDALRTFSAPANPFFDFVLRGRGTMVEQAVSLDPTFVLVWLGANEVLCAATSGSPDCLTSLDDFEADYAQVLDTFLDLPSVTGIVTANVPDVLSIPFVTTVPPFFPNPFTGQAIPLLGPDGPLEAGDRVTLLGLPLIRQGVGLPEPIGNGEPLPDNVVLNAAELATIRTQGEAINEAIFDIAGSRGVPVVDVASILSQVREVGFRVGGIEFTTSYIQGGVFSLDGVHPWSVAYGVAANAFIETINATYGSKIPLVNLGKIMEVNFDPESLMEPNLEALAPAIEAIAASPWSRAALGF